MALARDYSCRAYPIPLCFASFTFYVVEGGAMRRRSFLKTVAAVAPAAAGGSFVMEHTHLLPGGPPLHHLYQEEWFCVTEGEVAFQVGEQRVQLHAGESVLAPRLVAHTFSSVGATPGRLLIAFCPAGKMGQYFRDAENAKASAVDAAFMRRYEMEMVGPSPFWKS
jgi:mannose-6-phosphate isomerase-like protein (cupin superfamily)